MTVHRNAHRGNRWQYDFRRHGKRYQGYCVDPATGKDAKSKHEARACEALRRREVGQADNVRRSVSRPGSYSLAEALTAHIDSQSASSPMHVSNLKLYSREILAFFGEDTTVADVTQSRVDEYRRFAASQKRTVWAAGARKRTDLTPAEVARFTKASDEPRSAASANHYLKCLRAALGRAHRTRDPITGGPMLPFPPLVEPLPTIERQPTPMPRAELRARLAKARPWVRDAAELAVQYGLRRAEVLGLTLANVVPGNKALRLDGESTKSGRDEFAHSSTEGWAVLRRLVRQAKARGVERLITWPGQKGAAAMLAGRTVPAKAWRPLLSLGRSWRTTAKAAGVVAPHRFHDLRARYITEVAKGASSAFTQQAARHRDPVTTQRYTGLTTDEVARAVESALRPKKRALRAV